MDKDDWWFPAFAVILVAVSAFIGIMYGHQAGVENALVRVCNQTNGRYDFCKPVPKYEIILERLNK